MAGQPSKRLKTRNSVFGVGGSGDETTGDAANSKTVDCCGTTGGTGGGHSNSAATNRSCCITVLGETGIGDCFSPVWGKQTLEAAATHSHRRRALGMVVPETGINRTIDGEPRAGVSQSVDVGTG